MCSWSKNVAKIIVKVIEKLIRLIFSLLRCTINNKLIVKSQEDQMTYKHDEGFDNRSDRRNEKYERQDYSRDSNRNGGADMHSKDSRFSEKHSDDKRDYSYALPKIGVIGVGGAGTNIVNSIIDYGLEGVKCVVCNTDAQALNKSDCQTKVHLRSTDRKSDYGAGGEPDLGKRAAADSIKEIFNALGEVDMLFIVAGAGGGTGSGGAPEIAKVAKGRGILTIGFVTKPFDFEGSNRARIANETIRQMQENVDCLVVAKNQQLLQMCKGADLTSSFALINSVLYSGIAGIVNIINRHGVINVDFQDVQKVLKNRMNRVVFGVGVASGEHAGKTAAELAITNQLLEIDTDTLHQVDTALIAITGGKNLSLIGVSEAVEFLRQQISSDNENIIIGMSIDEEFEDDKVEVCIFASCPNMYECKDKMVSGNTVNGGTSGGFGSASGSSSGAGHGATGLSGKNDKHSSLSGVRHDKNTAQVESANEFVTYADLEQEEQDDDEIEAELQRHLNSVNTKWASQMDPQQTLDTYEGDDDLYIGKRHLSLQETKEHFKNSDLDGVKIKSAEKHNTLFSRLWKDKRK